MLLTHDFPDPTSHSPKRVTTTTTLQGLYALNGPMILARSEALASRLMEKNSRSDEERIAFAYQLLFARSPTERETALALEFVTNSKGNSERDLWIQYAQVLLASNEFLFLN